MSTGQQRIPINRPPKAPADGVLNVIRDAHLARAAYGDSPPKLFPAMTLARQAQIADNVDELDDKLLDVIIAAWATLERIRTAFPHLTVRHSA
jgi:hypothetical protein